MRYATHKKGFVAIQDISMYNPHNKYQVFYASNKRVEPITKLAKNKTQAKKIAATFKKKLLKE